GGHVPRCGTLRFGLFQAQRLNRNHAIAAGASGDELDHSIGFALRRAAVARSLQADGDAAVENVAIGVDHLAVHQAADQLAVRAIHAVATQGADNVALGITDDLHDVLLHIEAGAFDGDRKSTRLNSSHVKISYAVFCLKKKRIIAVLTDT